MPDKNLKILKMTEPFRQYRTRLFLPIKGKQDISKSSVSRWISYTVKLAYRKLTNKDFPFLKINAHEVRALSSSWAFFNKVLLSEILKAAVWNQSSTCRPRWLSWMRCPTGDQEVAGQPRSEVGNILSWRLIMKYFLHSFSPFC